MSRHASHVPAGITPARISSRKTQQPAQNPTIDSRRANTSNTPTSIEATVRSPKARLITAAEVENTSPTDWAKRFGGPGTSRGGPRRGATTFVAICPSGLHRGPANTRSKKPSATTTSNQCHPVTSVTTACIATPAATTRAAFSLTGFGKLKTVDKKSILLPTG